MTDIGLSSPILIDDSPSRPQINQTFTASSIENMLKRKDNRKEFKVIENNQKKSSTAWATFGFPARLIENGTYERIHGLASCFQCKSTYTFHSDGSGSTKHLLRHVCSKSTPSSEHYHEGPLEKLFKSKKTTSVTLNSKDSTKVKDDLTKWICTSIRPFNIIEDPGRKYQDLVSSQLLVTPTTISKNVHQLVEQYRSLLQPILIEQAANSSMFTNKNYELILFELFSFCIYYFLETILKLWSLRPRVFFKYVFNTFDAILALSLFVLHIVHWSMYGTLSITNIEIDKDSSGTASSIWAITRIINLFVVFRTIRSMPHFTNYGIIMGTISDGMRNLKAFIGILICLFYVYAVLGMWLFRGVIKAPTESDLVNATCGSYQQSNYWANNFDDFFSTVVILYDVMLVNNWGVFLSALREFSTRWSQLYLVSWWFLSNVYILALVLGFIVELFALNVARFEESGFAQRENGLANTYFVKTLFHLFKRSLKEPSDEEINKALVKYKLLYVIRQ
ncbi:unnamed protein product [Rotaria sp. Silwood1]|nr:unnamed protein product [Rotaria sp. Silwood1]